MVLSNRTRSNGHMQTQEFSSQYQETLFICGVDQTLVEVILRGCRIPLLGDTQTFSGHMPGQSALGVSA